MVGDADRDSDQSSSTRSGASVRPTCPGGAWFGPTGRWRRVPTRKPGCARRACGSAMATRGGSICGPCSDAGVIRQDPDDRGRVL